MVVLQGATKSGNEVHLCVRLSPEAELTPPSPFPQIFESREHGLAAVATSISTLVSDSALPPPPTAHEHMDVDRVTVQRRDLRSVTLRFKTKVEEDEEITTYHTTHVITCALPVDDDERASWGQERKGWRVERRGLNKALDANRKENKQLRADFTKLKSVAARAVSRANSAADYAVALFTDRLHSITRSCTDRKDQKRAKASATAASLATARRTIVELRSANEKLKAEQYTFAADARAMERRMGSQRGVIQELKASHELETARVREEVEAESEEAMRIGLAQVVEAAAEGVDELHTKCASLTCEIGVLQKEMRAKAKEAERELQEVERRHIREELKAQPPMGRSTEQWQCLNREAEKKAR